MVSNNSLLKDRNYIDKITEVINLELSNPTFANPSLRWEYIKYKIRNETITFSKHKARNQRQEEKDLLKIITRLESSYYGSNSPEILGELKDSRNRLNLLYENKLAGIIIRSRAQWVESGERNTKYFLNLEKRNKTNNVIHKLKTANDNVVTKNIHILSELREFYANLYTSDNVNPTVIFGEGSIGNHTKLESHEADCCDGPLTNIDCISALKSLTNGKSPGSDGLSVDFYKHFWSIIGNCVVESLNYSNDNVFLSAEQGRSIITLIPKPGKDKEYIKNYRPISLLNTDYKICAKVLATRIQLVLSKIISPNQTGFLKNRFIGENVRFVLDLIDYYSNSNKTGLMFLVDFEKAFDSIEREFIYTSLQFFGFGDSFISWVKTICSNNTGRIINNGHSSS